MSVTGGVDGLVGSREEADEDPSIFRIGFKSPATISQDQQTVTYDGKAGTLATRGRHDPCVVPRAVPIVEAMAALTLMDALMAQDARATTAGRLASEPVLDLPNSMRLVSKMKTGKTGSLASAGVAVAASAAAANGVPHTEAAQAEPEEQQQHQKKQKLDAPSA